ncbi:hypothetical protein QP948_10375 [Corynebacterium bovis]|uniref:hypothetical protein n=1 Tax=Corynebacterium bovis TaxID=36808 RepID=UPI00254E6ADF|nr:hypothetical protein [Corynebacterium bovis]MDK8511790.1 hypothetical protein [Corynebacterium bovis]
MDTARIVFRHDPGASPQWSYYGVNAPVTGSAERLSEAKFAATQDIQFLSGDSHPHMTAFVEWRALESVRGLPAIYVRAVQDEDTNVRLNRQNLAQAYVEAITGSPEIQRSVPSLYPVDAVPDDVILVTLFPEDRLDEVLANLSPHDSVVLCLPEGASLNFMPLQGCEVWPEEGEGLLEQIGLTGSETVAEFMGMGSHWSDDDSTGRAPGDPDPSETDLGDDGLDGDTPGAPVSGRPGDVADELVGDMPDDLRDTIPDGLSIADADDLGALGDEATWDYSDVRDDRDDHDDRDDRDDHDDRDTDAMDRQLEDLARELEAGLADELRQFDEHADGGSGSGGSGNDSTADGDGHDGTGGGDSDDDTDGPDRPES